MIFRIKKIKIIDYYFIGVQAFLIRLGVEPKGICASGTVVSNSFKDVHYSDPAKVFSYVMIEFDIVLNPNEQPLLSFSQLWDELLDQTWDPESSGMPFKPEVLEEFESRWLRFLDVNWLLDLGKEQDTVLRGRVFIGIYYYNSFQKYLTIPTQSLKV